MFGKNNARSNSDIMLVYKVMLPSIVVWPGKVCLNISYTRAAAEEFIANYPNKWMSAWMSIETQEILVFRETD